MIIITLTSLTSTWSTAVWYSVALYIPLFIFTILLFNTAFYRQTPQDILYWTHYSICQVSLYQGLVIGDFHFILAKNKWEHFTCLSLFAFFSEFTETYLLACLVDYFDNNPDFKRFVMLDLVCSVQMYVVQDDQLVLKESAWETAHT